MKKDTTKGYTSAAEAVRESRRRLDGMSDDELARLAEQVAAREDSAALNAQAKAEQAQRGALREHASREAALSEQARAQRELDASMSPALQRECGLGALQSAKYGSAAGIATTAYRDPQTMFTRAEVLAILRAINATDGRFHEAITAFERME